MSDEVRTLIFEPFFTTKGVGEVSGLGLGQVFGFVQQGRGRITVDSEPSHGNTVTLYFPRVEPAPCSASLTRLDAMIQFPSLVAGEVNVAKGWKN